MEVFLAIHAIYDHLELALFQGEKPLFGLREDKYRASKTLIPLIHQMLTAHNVLPKNLSFITVNQGPGPFTSLRTVIASVNGISFATEIPLIGVDGLDAFVHEIQDSAYPNTAVLLNAFNKDVYFAIQKNGTIEKGCKNIQVLLQELQTTMPDTLIRFVGNGTSMYEKEIRETFGDHAHIPKPIPQICSLTQVGLMALQQWKDNKEKIHQLSPLYLKNHPAASGAA